MKDPFERKKIPYKGHNIMTYSSGEGQEALLLISGGPGCPCNFLRDTHQQYVEKGLRVVTWDQLGCGESDPVEDPAFWEIPRFVEEVEHLRQALNLKKMHLLGQSWGGVLGLEYILKYPQFVKSFVIASSAFNIPLMRMGFERIKLALGHETLRMMARREADNSTEHPEYRAAYTILAYRHLCRLPIWPECLKESMKIPKNMLSKVFGNYLFNCTGLLRNYDRTDELKNVQQPCLIIHGEYDFIIPECATISRDYLPNASLHLLENCSHHTFLENPDIYHRIVGSFISKHLN